jgi:hypothetical protein
MGHVTGSPRLSPVEPLVLDGDLWLSMMWQSRQEYDTPLLIPPSLPRDSGRGLT